MSSGIGMYANFIFYITFLVFISYRCEDDTTVCLSIIRVERIKVCQKDLRRGGRGVKVRVRAEGQTRLWHSRGIATWHNVARKSSSCYISFLLPSSVVSRLLRIFSLDSSTMGERAASVLVSSPASLRRYIRT